MIEVQNLTKAFGDKTVLDNISVKFETGKTNLIIGQSGSGKTVLMKNLVGLLEPTSGKVLYDGRDFVQMSKKEKVMMRREMGMIFQSAALFDSLNVLENVMFPLDMFSTMNYRERVRRAQECLDRVNLGDAQLKYPGEISGGMQKRVAIARAIVLNPKYLFCDEPNSGLDPHTSLVIDQLLSSITKEYNITTIINTHDMNSVMGIGENILFIYQGNDYAGVVTGLAWTSVGGEILFIETSLSKGKAGKLTLTGNLGDVMKESAVIALEYVKAHIDALGVDYRLFDQWNIHIHVPEGATPKDGPSAGITIATSLASALTQRKVRKNTAMTGEITLRGKVLPVGGIKEKILAAKRAGITDIVMCQDNKKDIDEIPEIYLKGVTFHYVENVQDVWQFALTDETVDNPINLKIEEEKK